MLRITAGHGDVAAGHCRSDNECARLDPVRNDAVASAMQALNSLDPYGRGSSALDVGAHLDQQRGQVADLGFASTVLHEGLAVGESGRHQQVLGTGNGNFVEDDVPAAEPVGSRDDISVLL